MSAPQDADALRAALERLTQTVMVALDQRIGNELAPESIGFLRRAVDVAEQALAAFQREEPMDCVGERYHREDCDGSCGATLSRGSEPGE